MIEIWMKFHMVSDIKLQHYNPIIPQNVYKEWQIILGKHLVLVTLYDNLQLLVSSKTMRTDVTKYHI